MTLNREVPYGRGWFPFKTSWHRRPPVPGTLVALQHGVWRVAHLVVGDEEAGLVIGENGHADLAKSYQQPYTIELLHVGGVLPEGWRGLLGAGAPVKVRMTVPHLTAIEWRSYEDKQRWPQCSCCTEPWPCRAALQDAEIAESLDAVETRMSRRPGQCWHCGEALRPRQMVVEYEGDNLDLPGAPSPRFHARQTCEDAACAYEQRWLAVDPRRERVLTWPKCGGILIVHADGSSECCPGMGPFGSIHRNALTDCRGHTTSDHANPVACRSVAGWNLDSTEWFQADRCPRGCVPELHVAGRIPARRPRRAGVRRWV